MPVHVGWDAILLRLTLAVIAGSIIGLDRGERSRPAGLRTTLLVCLAAAFSMIQANLLLPTAGKPEDSFVTLDLMRLPLGILTGMGFIGGGAILKRGDIVRGVTTAATLWFVTIIGLCFGGGHNGLGVMATVLGIVILSGVKRIEDLLPQQRSAMLTLTASLEGATEPEIRSQIVEHGFRIASSGIRYDKAAGQWTFCCDLRWNALRRDPLHPPLVEQLARHSGILQLEWSPQGLPEGLQKSRDPDGD